MDFLQWIKYFEKNSIHFQDINWEISSRLNENEKETLKASLQQFQKGENSEGKHLINYAKTFSDDQYLKCIKLFINEEQTHAKVLGRFMEQNDIPKIKSHWLDNIFRSLRKFSGLHNTIIVLVTAEIIAKIFYKALEQATTSLLLKQICNQILKDEDEHIAFQCYTLKLLFARRNYMMKVFIRTFHLVLMVGTIFIVWLNHKRVLKKGGYFFYKFFLETLMVFLQASETVKTKYQFQQPSLAK